MKVTYNGVIFGGIKSESSTPFQFDLSSTYSKENFFLIGSSIIFFLMLFRLFLVIQDPEIPGLYKSKRSKISKFFGKSGLPKFTNKRSKKVLRASVDGADTDAQASPKHEESTNQKASADDLLSPLKVDEARSDHAYTSQTECAYVPPVIEEDPLVSDIDLEHKGTDRAGAPRRWADEADAASTKSSEGGTPDLLSSVEDIRSNTEQMETGDTDIQTQQTGAVDLLSFEGDTERNNGPIGKNMPIGNKDTEFVASPTSTAEFLSSSGDIQDNNVEISHEQSEKISKFSFAPERRKKKNLFKNFFKKMS